MVIKYLLYYYTICRAIAMYCNHRRYMCIYWTYIGFNPIFYVYVYIIHLNKVHLEQSIHIYL